MWFAKAVARGQGQEISCYTDLTSTYVFPTLFSEYPVFNVFSMELLILDITDDEMKKKTAALLEEIIDGVEEET